MADLQRCRVKKADCSCLTQPVCSSQKDFLQHFNQRTCTSKPQTNSFDGTLNKVCLKRTMTDDHRWMKCQLLDVYSRKVYDRFLLLLVVFENKSSDISVLHNHTGCVPDTVIVKRQELDGYTPEILNRTEKSRHINCSVIKKPFFLQNGTSQRKFAREHMKSTICIAVFRGTQFPERCRAIQQTNHKEQTARDHCTSRQARATGVKSKPSDSTGRRTTKLEVDRRTASKKTTSLVIVFLFLMGSRTAGAVDVCIPGHFLYTPKEGPDICLKCYPGTFMPYHLHKYRQCFECSQIQDPQLEILVSHCNTQHDTDIQCIDGYFRTNSTHPGEGGQCQKCKECPYVKHSCQKDRDTLCCPGEDYAVRVNRQGNPVCVPLCGRGQFWDPASEQCLTCPIGTFMLEEKHTHIYCWNCHTPNEANHEVLIRSCGPTHPAIIGCMEGFYKQSSSIYPFEGCAKCQVCSESTTGHVYEIRPCNETYNTVCCSHPNMTVIDTSEGPECRHIVTSTPHKTVSLDKTNVIELVQLCGKGEYLSINTNSSSGTCLPCRRGTCMPEINHVKTSCEVCNNQEQKMDEDEHKTTSGCSRDSICNTSVLSVVLFCVLRLSFDLINPKS